jgi:hypothetical protein
MHHTTAVTLLVHQAPTQRSTAEPTLALQPTSTPPYSTFFSVSTMVTETFFSIVSLTPRLAFKKVNTAFSISIQVPI